MNFLKAIMLINLYFSLPALVISYAVVMIKRGNGSWKRWNPPKDPEE